MRRARLCAKDGETEQEEGWLSHMGIHERQACRRAERRLAITSAADTKSSSGDVIPLSCLSCLTDSLTLWQTGLYRREARVSAAERDSFIFILGGS